MIKSKEELINHCPGLRALNNDICYMYCYILVIIFVSEHRPPKGESIFCMLVFHFTKYDIMKQTMEIINTSIGNKIHA